ncbi:MAG: hypothetical protein WBF03_01095 [Xanthobacteraceae bacterium]
MPTVATSHFVIDLPTLFVLTVFLSTTGGLLLLFSWAQNRNTPALAFWGIVTSSAPLERYCWARTAPFPASGRFAAPTRYYASPTA